MTIGIAKTQIANPANVAGSSGAGSSLMPLAWSRFFINDSAAGSVQSDTPLKNGVNYTNQVSSFVLLTAGNDIPMNKMTGGIGQQFQGITDGNANGGAQGILWRMVKIFNSRILPLPGTFGANSDAIIYSGIAADNGTGGLKPSILFLPANPNWINSIASAGFYYRRSQSTNWILQTTNGSGGVSQLDSGVAVDTTLSTPLYFTFDGATVSFYIYGSKVGKLTANLPPSNTPMCNNLIFGNAGTGTTVTATACAFAYQGFAYF